MPPGKVSFIHWLFISCPPPPCQAARRETDVSLFTLNSWRPCCLFSRVLEWFWIKGVFSALFLLQCLDASRPWLCYWILHSLELLDEPIPQMLATEWVWLWGTWGVLWNCILTLGFFLFCFCFIYFEWKTQSTTKKPLPFSWPPVTSWNSSTSEAHCMLMGRIRLWTPKRRILFLLWPFLLALALVFEKSLHHQLWRNMILPESTVRIWIASVGKRMATQGTKMPLLSVNTSIEVPRHQCLGGTVWLLMAVVVLPSWCTNVMTSFS